MPVSYIGGWHFCFVWQNRLMTDRQPPADDDFEFVIFGDTEEDDE